MSEQATTSIIKTPDTALFAGDAADMSTVLERYQVSSDETFGEAGRLVQAGLGLIAKIEEDCNPPIDQSHKLHKSLLALRDKYRAPLSLAVDVLKRRMGAFLQERRRRQEEEEAKLREAQRRQEEERLLREAAEVKRETGSDEAALAVLERPIETVAVQAAPALKVSGISAPEIWKFRIVDANAIPREYLMVDEVAIGKVVRALKAKTRIAGVEVYPESSIRAAKAAV